MLPCSFRMKTGHFLNISSASAEKRSFSAPEPLCHWPSQKESLAAFQDLFERKTVKYLQIRLSRIHPSQRVAAVCSHPREFKCNTVDNFLKIPFLMSDALPVFQYQPAGIFLHIPSLSARLFETSEQNSLSLSDRRLQGRPLCSSNSESMQNQHLLLCQHLMFLHKTIFLKTNVLILLQNEIRCLLFEDQLWALCQEVSIFFRNYQRLRSRKFPSITFYSLTQPTSIYLLLYVICPI